MPNSRLFSRRAALTNALLATTFLVPVAAPRAQSLLGIVARVVVPVVIIGGAIGLAYYLLKGSSNAAEAATRETEDQRRKREAAIEAEKPYAERLAKLWGTDLPLAQEVVHSNGIPVAQKVLDGSIPVWPMRVVGENQARRFDVVIHNNSPQAVVGAMCIGIDDVATGTRELQWAYRGYRVEPYKTLKETLPFDGVLRPGVKRVVLLDQPPEVITEPPVELLVIPAEIAMANTPAATRVRGKS